MVEKNHPQLSVRRQSELLAVNRNRLKPERVSEPPELSEADAQVARRMDEIYLRFPEFGARRMSQWLMREGYPVSRRRAGRLMDHMGLEAIYRKPRTSVPRPGAQKISVPFEGALSGDGRRSVVCGHYLHPDEPRLCVLGGGDGLAHTSGVVVEAVQHHGWEVLRGSVRGGVESWRKGA